MRASGNKLRHGQNDRAIALGKKNYLFAGSDTGGDRAAALYTLIQTAKLNGLDSEAYFRDVLTRIADHPIFSPTLTVGRFHTVLG